MRILVTGGAGFIGSHTCDELLKQNHKVMCLDNFNDYYNSDFKEENIAHNLNNPNFKLIRADITNYASLEQIFKQHSPEKIIHLAARAGVRPSIEDPFIYEQTNVRGTLNLLELSKIYSVKQFIFASSSSVYGCNEKVPFAESDHTRNPVSPYAATKKSGEVLCHTYSKLYKIPTTCLRFFTVYGPGGRPDMAPYMFTKLIYENKPIKKFGNGTTKRDYTFVSDIVQGIISSLDHEFKYEIFNLGNNHTVKLNYFIEIIEGLVGKKAVIDQHPMQPGDVPITYADLTKSKKLLGYNPTTSIEKGLKIFVDWFLQNRANRD
ncbi:NAD-dependent epimerase/dehydratase family protein [Candidatus Woesearchaeota archaeon]|jgi:UDP-glucuronate 4-epimerase|nr:NAD-dependent epimerase/dehydratase family protein [Candidatus Woesearchaeota archaeon]MBT7367616.1 NAD-dependent epimerase/dehydratase family protein [Candidatus Woesearchaeota archaeon]